MSRMGNGRMTTQNNITLLSENGYIEKVGSNKNEYWRVIENY